PHDIATYPGLPRGLDPDAKPIGPLMVPAQGTWSNTPTAGTLSLNLNPLAFPQDNANVPPSLDDPLTNKPACQFDYAYKMGLALASKTGLSAQQQAGLYAVNAALLSGIPFQLTADPFNAALRFVQYYAWLQHLVDGHIRSVLDALDESGQRDNTIVVFMADHGEYGGAHNYMIEKWHTAYQEALHVPVVIQSAKLNAEPDMRQIDALTSHVDIVPTLLGLAGLSEHDIARIGEALRQTRPVPPFPGVDLTAVIKGTQSEPTQPDGQVREGILFVTDDEITERLHGDLDPHQVHSDREFKIFLEMVDVVRDGSSKLPFNGPVPQLAPGPVRQPNHVRCVRSGEWKLVRYWDPNQVEADEWELYDLEHDG
ncbi:MAG: sulfatase-like hydrolase/transferase, partial [Lysobacter sp.]|nr:sulfatase-like hydrolase/transferase [Lysobacter sp.]